MAVFFPPKNSIIYMNHIQKNFNFSKSKKAFYWVHFQHFTMPTLPFLGNTALYSLSANAAQFFKNNLLNFKYLHHRFISKSTRFWSLFLNLSGNPFLA